MALAPYIFSVSDDSGNLKSGLTPVFTGIKKTADMSDLPYANWPTITPINFTITNSTTVTASATPATITVPAPLNFTIPNGTTLQFGASVVVLNAASLAGSTAISVASVPSAIAANATAVFQMRGQYYFSWDAILNGELFGLIDSSLPVADVNRYLSVVTSLQTVKIG